FRRADFQRITSDSYTTPLSHRRPVPRSESIREWMCLVTRLNFRRSESEAARYAGGRHSTRQDPGQSLYHRRRPSLASNQGPDRGELPADSASTLQRPIWPLSISETPSSRPSSETGLSRNASFSHSTWRCANRRSLLPVRYNTFAS